MNVDLMRWIDFWIGVPICFFLSVLASLQRLFWIRKLPKNFKPKKILFIELSEMGSTILAYSAIKKAKKMFDAEVFFMIFKENEESINLLNVVPKKNVLTIRSKSPFLFVIDTIKVIFEMRARGIDTVIDLELFSRFTSILGLLSGSKAIVGFYRYHMEGLYRGNFQTHKVMYNPHYHISQGFMALVYALENGLGEGPILKKEIPVVEVICPKIASSIEAKKAMIKKLQAINPKITSESNIVLINPNASKLLPIRKWPIENYMELAKRILKLDGVFIVITGVKSEKSDAQAICKHVYNNRCIDFTGQTSFKELIDLYNVSKILVSNDSGPAHFASLSDIYIMVLFGPESPNLYGPLSKNANCFYSHFACSPCVSAFNHRKTTCKSNKCLKAIKVEDVFDELEKKL